MSVLEESVLVEVQFDERGPDGPGWYVWEAEYPEEGCVGFFKDRPSPADLSALCPEYMEEV